jgi:hypothetical protein
MMRGNDLRLIELAFNYVSAETMQQADQVDDQAVVLATEVTTLKVWLDLIDYLEKWNHNSEHKSPMSWANALQFFSTRQAKLCPDREPMSQNNWSGMAEFKEVSCNSK